MALNIADLFEHAVDAVPDRTAVIAGPRTLTYAQIENEANQLAHLLQSNGIGHGDHVGVLAPNTAEHVVAILALFKIRAVPINLNYRYTAPELAYVFDNADLVGLCFDDSLGPLASQVLTQREPLRVLVSMGAGIVNNPMPEALAYASARDEFSTERDFGQRSPDDLYVLYTGGTTGYPKGVVWRHEDIWRTLGGGTNFMTGELLDEYDQSTQAATNPPIMAFAVSPLMHGAAVWGTLMHLFSGHTTVLIDKFEAHAVWELIDRHGVQTVFITGDAMARPLIEAFDTGRHSGASLAAVASSAALFSPAVKKRWIDAFSRTVFTDSIGASEVGFTGTTILERDNLAGEGPLVQMAAQTIVVDDDLNILDPEEHVGQTARVARAGHIPLGYYNDEEKSRTTFFERDGIRFSVPGDYVRIEAGRRLRLLGRGSNCINTGGEKVFAEEVEQALKSHPNIYDAIVVAVPDPRWGQRVAAVVQARDGLRVTIESIHTHLRTMIAGYKLPRDITFVDAVPRHVTGKANYPEARKIMLASLEPTQQPTH
ncbi:acyl-CoA synthetase [Mycobacterium ahvazicum]|uniref:Acyl-CoA synthetase n=1 Tax=Mycobacterium ahvazicum TaxID=1964395 RepID=A0A2K4YG62_9MYCO|nr:acyl-CoA synthetase [Mycobacterium ahvazicum]SOX55776.1 acyl-CoA synthetase [Mycobacterium ahvazicum]